jgi:hypothetical protein
MVPGYEWSDDAPAIAAYPVIFALGFGADNFRDGLAVDARSRRHL